MNRLNWQSGELRRITGALWLLCAALVMWAAAADVWAQTLRPFGIRYSINTTGDILHTGNNLASCYSGAGPATIGACVNAMNTSAANPLDRTVNRANGSIVTFYIDFDGDAFGPTFNSSSADVTMPAGSVVKFAGLYWAGRSTSPARGQILFKTPASAGYNSVAAANLDGPSAAGSANNYAAFADVTALVAAAGNGTYWGANVQSSPGIAGNWAGWALIIVYESNTLPLRNLVVFDGYAGVDNLNPLTLSLAGFLTPFSGPVVTKVGSVGWDGDAYDTGTTGNGIGDALQVSSSTNPTLTTISNAFNPADDFYNSTISDGGVLITNRNPADANTFGVDIDRFTLPAGVVGNGATSATIRMTTGGEGYLPAAITFMTDIYVPIISQNLVKTVTDLNGGNIEPGDILRWNISMSNTGYDTGTNLVLVDPIPTTVTYVPGSLVINTAPPGGAVGGMNDAIAAPLNDQADFRTGPNRVVFRLGAGGGTGNPLNDQANGGSLAYTQSTSIQFDTTVNAVAAGTVISNAATIYYSGQTLSGTNFSSASSATSATVLGGPTIAKSFTPSSIPAGGTSQLKITIANPVANPGNLNGVSFIDIFPSGMTVSASPAVGYSCTAGSSQGAITGGAATNNFIGTGITSLPGATILPGGSCDITVNVTATPGGNYVNTISSVSATNVSSASAGVTATLTAGKLAISKSFTPSTILAGQSASLSVTITNPTAALVTGVSFTDTFPANLVIAATPGPNPSPPCGVGSSVLDSASGTLGAGDTGIRLTAGQIAANSSCTFAVNVTGVTATTFGIFNNTTGGVTHSADVVAGNPSNTATLTIVGAPVLTKTIIPAFLNLEDTATLRLTLNNPNTTATITRAAAAFLDTYPTNLINLNAASGGAIVTNNCSFGSSTAITAGTGAAGGSTLGMSNVSIAPGGSCTLTSVIKVNAAHVLGLATNGTTVVTFDNAPQGGHATASYTVTGLLEPTVTKSFSNTAVSAGSAVTLTITLVQASTTTNITGVAFTDTFPLGMVNTTGAAVIGGAAGCAGTATVTAGALSVSGLTIPFGAAPANRTCTVTTTVTANTPGVYFNVTGTVTSTNAPPQTTQGTATLNTYRGLDVVKSFVPSSVAVGGMATLTFTITNPSGNPGAISASNIVDNFPANLVVGPAVGTPVITNCPGIAALTDAAAVAHAAAQTSLRILNVSIPIGTPCVVSINVTPSVAGNYLNTVELVSSSASVNGVFPVSIAGTSNTATLSAGKVGIAKAFSPATITNGATSTLTFTLTNGSAAAVSGINFTDLLTSLPTRQITLASGTVGGTCTGVVSNAVVNGTSFIVTAGNVPVSSSCTITLQVTSTVTGIHANQTTGVSHAADPTPGAVSNIANLTVVPPPILVKSFLPSQVGQGLRSTLSLTVTNINPFPVGNLAVTDTFPGGLLVATPLQTSNSCGGVISRAASVAALAGGDSGFQLSGGTVATNSSCVISVSVTAATAGSYVNTIAAGDLTSNTGSNPTAASATLDVLQLLNPVLKFFTPTAIVAGGTSVLTVRLTNPNPFAITGAAFTDTYPANLFNTATPAGATSCPSGSVTAAANGSSLSLSGATVPANNFCDITVNVTSPVTGVRTNPAFNVTTANAGTAVSNPADLSVGVPSITKTFSPNPIAPGGVSTISFLITNPNAVAMTNVGFIDNFPSTMTLAYPASASQCGGTLYNQVGTTPPPAASTGIRLGNASGVGGGSVAANSTCTIQVAVTTPTAGVRINTTSAVTAGALVGDTATDTLTTFSPPTVTKSFTPTVAGANVPVVLTIRIDNSNAFPMIGAAFADTYPANLVNTASPSGATTCSGGLVSAAGGGASLALSGAVIPPSSFCLVTVNVSGSTAGALVNNVLAGAVTTTNAGSNVAAANATLTVLAPPTVVKSFIGPNYAAFSLAGTTMPLNTPTVMRITLTNPTSGAAITGAAFNDNYPSGLVNSAVPNATISGAGCTGTLTAAAAGTSLALNNMTIPASGTCTINVNVQSAISAFYTNSTGVVTTTNAGNAAAASGTIYAMAPLLASKNFTPNFLPNPVSGPTSGMTVSLVNPNPYPVTNGLIVDNYNAAGLGGLDIDNVAVPLPSFVGAGCTGTLTATAGAATSAMELRNATVPANATCIVNVAVVVAAAGDKTNCTGALTTANAGTTASVCATINQGATATNVPPSMTKSFTPSSIAVNAVSTLSFTVTNINVAPNNITATNFTDVLPAGLLVATPAVVTNSCGGTWNATAGSSILNLTGATVISASSCVVSVQVTGNASGIYNNVAGVVSGSTGVGNQATATLTILDPPSITKAFTPSTINQGGFSTISFVVTNNNASIVSSLAFTDTLTGMTIVNPPVPAVSGAGCTGYTVTAPSGGSLISVSGGNVPARVGVVPGTCTITVRVTSAVAGTWPNATSQTTSSAGTGAGSNNANLTVNAVTSTVSGYVFIDANANGTRNPGEDWASGVLVYVNIVSGGTVVQSQAVNAGVGFFNFPSVPFGNYTILVTNSPVNASVVVPGGFTATQPTGSVWNLLINGSLIPLQEFGFVGPALSQVSGRVFRDTGFGTASPATLANNGILDAGEGGSSPGLSGVAVAATDCAATTFSTVSTDGGGNYTLRFPSTATTVCIVETNPVGYLSTGASQSLTALTASSCAAPPGGGAFEYDRSNDRICFSKTGGSNVTYANLNFGDVPVNTWVPDQTQQTTPGNFVTYPHVFTYETGGSVTFSTTVVATNPNMPGWSEVLYRDTDCDGRIDAAEPIIAGAVAVTATAPPGNKVCVIVRQFSPPSAPFGAQRVVRVDAGFTYTNAAPALTATYSRTDTTVVEDKAASGLRLVKEVCNETTLTCTDASIDSSSLTANGNYGTSNAARSGDVLRYRIIYTNTASGPVNNVVINDTTPPFTNLFAAPPLCPVLPSGVTCTPAPTPAVVCAPGVSCAVRWTLNGTLPPGAQGVVVFRSQVQ